MKVVLFWLFHWWREVFKSLGRVFRAATLLIAAAFMLISSTSFAACTFSDVGEDDPAYKAIKFLCGEKIIVGYGDGTFKPNDSITRLHLAKIAILTKAFIDGQADVEKYLGELNSKATQEKANATFLNQFADRESLLRHASWSALGGIIYYASEKKIIEGRQDKTKNIRYFAPDSTITRAEALKIFATTLGKNTIFTQCNQPYTKVSKNAWFCPHINALYFRTVSSYLTPSSNHYLSGLVRGNESTVTDSYFNSNLTRGEMTILACNAIALTKGLDVKTCLSENASCFLDQKIVGQEFIYKIPTEGIFTEAIGRVFLHWSDSCQKNWAVVTPAPAFKDYLSSSQATVKDDGTQSKKGNYSCLNKEGNDSICSPLIQTAAMGCAYAIGVINGNQVTASQNGCEKIQNSHSGNYIYVGYDDKDNTVVYQGMEEIGKFHDEQSGDGFYTYKDPSDTLTSLESGSKERYNCEISLEDFKTAFNIADYKAEYGIPCRYERKYFGDFYHEAVLFIKTTSPTNATVRFKSSKYDYWQTLSSFETATKNAGLKVGKGSFYFSPVVATFVAYIAPEGVLPLGFSDTISTAYYDPNSGNVHVVKDKILTTLMEAGFNTDGWCSVVTKEVVNQCGTSSKETWVAAYLGFPTSGESTADSYNRETGVYQEFAGGRVYKKDTTSSAYYVYRPTAVTLDTELSPVVEGKTGSAGYGFPKENPKYNKETNCIDQEFTSGLNVVVCGDNMSSIVKGNYSIKITKTLDQLNKEEFNEGFYDTFAEIEMYGIAYEIGAELAFDSLISKIKRLPLAKRFGEALAKKLGGKIAAKAVPVAGWVLLGVDVAITTEQISGLIVACNSNDPTDGKSASYYCGKALAYGILIGALGAFDEKPTATSIFGVSSTTAINGKSKLLQKFPTVNPSDCSRTRKAPSLQTCDLIKASSDFKEQLEQARKGYEDTKEYNGIFFNRINGLADDDLVTIGGAKNRYHKALDILAFREGELWKSELITLRDKLRNTPKYHKLSDNTKGGILTENQLKVLEKELNKELNVTIIEHLSKKGITVPDGAFDDKNFISDQTALFEILSILYKNERKKKDSKATYEAVKVANTTTPDWRELCGDKVSKFIEVKQVTVSPKTDDTLNDNLITNGFNKRIGNEKFFGNTPLEMIINLAPPSSEEDGINEWDEGDFKRYLDRQKSTSFKTGDSVIIRTRYDIYEYYYTSGFSWNIGSIDLCN